MNIKIGNKTKVFLYLILIIISVSLYYNIDNKLSVQTSITNNDVLDFRFSMKDIERFNCFYQAFIDNNIKFSSDLMWNNEDISVDISPINYYTRGVLSSNYLAFKIKTNKRNTIHDRREYEMFPIESNKINEYRRVVDLARNLKLFIPDTYYFSMNINNASYGSYAMRQQYNKQFLQENHLNNSLIFKIYKNKNQENKITILASNLEEKDQDDVKDILNNLLHNDINLNYIDIDYIARLKALANIESLNEDFYITDNTIYIYNCNNNKIYPTIDEAYLSLLDTNNVIKLDLDNIYNEFNNLMNNDKLISKSQQYMTKLIELKDKDILYTKVSKDIKMQYGTNMLEKLTIGNKQAIIDNKNMIIFANLDNGASTIQNIKYECSLENTPIKIKNYKNEELLIHNNMEFDFQEYVYRGQLSYEDNNGTSKKYKLIVTTGLVPVAIINTEDDKGKTVEIMKDDKIPCSFQLLSNNEVVNVLGDIEYKGDITSKKTSENISKEIGLKISKSISKNISKSSYDIKLNKSLNLSQDVRNYILDSNYNDPSFIRKKLSYDLLKEINSGTSTSSINTPECRFIELIVNGQYKGIYTLTEKINNELLGLDEYDTETVNNALIFKSYNENANFTANNIKLDKNDLYKSFPKGLQPISKDKDPLLGWHSGYKQKWPKVKEYGDQYREIEELIKYIATASDEEFHNNIFNKIDINNFINLNILMQLQNNIKGGYDNQYIVKNNGDNDKWFFIPCNDAVFGRDSNGVKTSELDIVSNNLINRCMSICKKQLISRWDVVSKDIIAQDNINRLIKNYSNIIDDASKRDTNNYNTNYQEELIYITDFISNRLDFLNDYYESLR